MTRDATTEATDWTGGQYSVFRALLGVYLLLHYALLVPFGAELFSSAGMLPDGSLSPLLRAFPNVLALCDAPAFVTALLLGGVALSGLVVAGRFDRAAAVGLWYLGACLLGRNPLIANPAMPFVGWLLLAHALLPAAPFGSWAARGRSDPDGGWRMPATVFASAWVVMALGYSYSGFTKLVSPSWVDGTALSYVLANPLARDTFLRAWLPGLPAPLLHVASWGALALELLFAPLALFRRLRPWLWVALVSMHLGLVVLVDFADLSVGMLLLHAFTFDPAWLPAARRRLSATVLYDGDCGLCHGFVRFLLAEDPSGGLRFAPLRSEAFAATLRPALAADPRHPSLAVLAQDGAVLTRSRAVLHLLGALGGLWRVLSWGGRLLPRALADALYDFVAARRRRGSGAPAGSCPLLPPHLRERFVA